MLRGFLVGLLLVNNGYAWNLLSCPAESKVLQQNVVLALQHPYDNTLWNFRTNPFLDKKHLWTIEFGSFFKENLSESEALAAGITYYNQIHLKIPAPDPMILNHMIQCDYMPAGGAFWFSAVAQRFSLT